jgi:hypothetical protein
MRRRLSGLLVVGAMASALSCNVDDEPVIYNPPNGKDVWSREDSGGDAFGDDVVQDSGHAHEDASETFVDTSDTSWEADTGIPDGGVMPNPSGLRLSMARMETLQSGLQSNRIRISDHSIEGSHRNCANQICVVGRIMP